MITIIGRSIYLVCVIVLWRAHNTDYRLYIIADIVGKIGALIYAAYQCKDIISAKPSSWKDGIESTKRNIATGMKLMFASISGMIITGMVRFAIQQEWDVATYGKISLTLSITNLVLTFISAMAIVLYPTLRRVSTDRAVSLYPAIRDILMALLLGSLIFCYPLQLIMLRILPQYIDSLAFLPILFPVCIYSAKVTLLVQTYMQVFRMEQMILQVNLVAIVVSLINTIISIFVLHSLPLAILSILVSAGFRCIFAEYVLSKYITITIWKDNIIESFYVMIFVLISYFVGMKAGMMIIIPIYTLYITTKAKAIKQALKTIKTY